MARVNNEAGCSGVFFLDTHLQVVGGCFYCAHGPKTEHALKGSKAKLNLIKEDIM